MRQAILRASVRLRDAYSPTRHEPSAVKADRPGTNSVSEIRAEAIAALQSLGSEAQSALPALVKNLEDENDTVRRIATNAVKKIRAQAAEEAGVR